MTTTVERVDVTGRTTAEAEAAFATLFPGVAFGHGAAFPFALLSVGVPGLSWVEHEFGGAGRLVDDNHDAYMVATMRGRVRATRGRTDLPSGEPVLLVEHAHFSSTWEDAEVGMVVLGSDVVRGTASRHWGRPAPDVLFDGERAVGAERAAYWQVLAEHVRRSFRDHPEVLTEPVVLRSLQRHVAVTLLRTFPNVLLADPPPLDVHGAVPSTVRHAVEYIDGHAHEPVTVDDVAAAVHLSTRGLQAAFRRALDTTPSEALRRSRLDGAHHALAAADPGSTTVAAVARRWGFAHAGRFAMAYRAAYGEHPSAALRR